jgi:macrolide transport system ATP-binding/permease protein
VYALDIPLRFSYIQLTLKPVLIKKISGLGVSIAAVSLIVGGVGIMGFMLVSVTEGTREIDLRTAEGADSKNILCQFPFEAVVLPLVRSSVEILVGHGGSPLVVFLMGRPTQASAGVVAVGLSVTVGITRGNSPAWKALRSNLTDALLMTDRNMGWRTLP